MILETNTFNIHALEGYIETLYLVEYPNKLLLLDGGCRCDASTVVQFIESIGRTMDDLKLIVVTHPHPDHSGAAPVLQRQYKIPIAASPMLNDWYRGISGWITQQVDIVLTYYVARKKKKPFKRLAFPRFIQIDHPLSSEDPLPFFEDWTLLFTPGHTTVDHSVFHEESSTAYLADLLIGLGTRYHSPYPIASPNQYRDSLATMRDRQIEHVLLAHHGLHTVPSATYNTLLNAVSDRPKNHRNSLAKIFGR